MLVNKLLLIICGSEKNKKNRVSIGPVNFRVPFFVEPFIPISIAILIDWQSPIEQLIRFMFFAMDRFSYF